jgi:hypothetical protein
VSPAPSPGSDDPDTGVVVRLSKGESGALQELMDAHWAPLVRYAAGILSGPADPQDLVQGVFLRLWDRRRRLKAQGSLKALLYTMVRNASLDELRRKARRAKAEGTTRGGAPPPPPPPHPPLHSLSGCPRSRTPAGGGGGRPAPSGQTPGGFPPDPGRRADLPGSLPGPGTLPPNRCQPYEPGPGRPPCGLEALPDRGYRPRLERAARAVGQGKPLLSRTSPPGFLPSSASNW